jgi:uncharacterized protein
MKAILSNAGASPGELLAWSRDFGTRATFVMLSRASPDKPRFHGVLLMSLSQQIDKDLVTAMKAKDELRLSTLRMVKTALKLKQVETGKPLEDSVATSVLRTLVKQRHDSAEQFRKGGREELAAKEEAEIRIVETYLPAAASDQEMDAAVSAALAETGATTAKEMGKVMKAAMARLAGKNVDGKVVSEKVRARLGG